MFAASGQFAVFLWYAVTGVLMGVAAEVGFVARSSSSGAVTRVVIDVLTGLAAGAVLFFMTVQCRHGALYAYAALAVGLGLAVERITLHDFVAKLQKIVYTGIMQRVRRRKARKTCPKTATGEHKRVTKGKADGKAKI